MIINIKKYDIWLVELEPTVGSEQSGIRPCLVAHNNIFFEYQKTSIILPITSKISKSGKSKILLDDYKSFGLTKASTILSFQVRTVDKSRFIKKLGNVKDKTLRKQINESLIMSLDINDDLLD